MCSENVFRKSIDVAQWHDGIWQGVNEYVSALQYAFLAEVSNSFPSRDACPPGRRQTRSLIYYTS